MDRVSREEMLIEIAHVVSKRSTCQRLAVGAVIAREGRVLSIGYAGVPPGVAHCNILDCDVSQPCTRTVHAEANAIVFAAKHGIPIEGSDLYCTHSPCESCTNLILNAGIKMVYYAELYRKSAHLRLINHVKLLWPV